jgi:hypothetical protein
MSAVRFGQAEWSSMELEERNECGKIFGQADWSSMEQLEERNECGKIFGQAEWSSMEQLEERNECGKIWHGYWVSGMVVDGCLRKD